MPFQYFINRSNCVNVLRKKFLRTIENNHLYDFALIINYFEDIFDILSTWNIVISVIFGVHVETWSHVFVLLITFCSCGCRRGLRFTYVSLIQGKQLNIIIEKTSVYLRKLVVRQWSSCLLSITINVSEHCNRDLQNMSLHQW